MMLAGLRKLLESDYEIVGTVLQGRALLEAAKTCQPDLVLADISMPEIDGIEATRRLRILAPEARVVILSLHTEPLWVQAAFEAGACGYLSKSSAPEEIEIALREVLQGRFYVSPEVTRGLFAALPEASAELGASPERGTDETLTPRESEIVHLVGKGLGNKEIARELGVSVTTVRTHLSRVYGKLEQGSRVELALYASNIAHISTLAGAEEVVM
jgi:DNA-binding NarL/FixJ family response regulator